MCFELLQGNPKHNLAGARRPSKLPLGCFQSFQVTAAAQGNIAKSRAQSRQGLFGATFSITRTGAGALQSLARTAAAAVKMTGRLREMLPDLCNLKVFTQPFAGLNQISRQKRIPVLVNKAGQHIQRGFPCPVT
ncbi:MAG: hypothetical protein GJ678_13460 [Rhodobacteraceae bacterium]|nr:hypothetical protein [Paracoccaceae bacterium]